MACVHLHPQVTSAVKDKKAKAKTKSVQRIDFSAVNCCPSTNEQRQQVRRLIALTDPIYDTVSTMHDEGQYMYVTPPSLHHGGCPSVWPLC